MSYDKVEFRAHVLVLVAHSFVYNIGNEDFVVSLYNENEPVHITMATFVIGTIGHFEDGVEMWDDYGWLLQQYYLANEVVNDKKVLALLSLMGPKTYELLQTLMAPEKPSTKTFEEMIEHFNRYLNPKPFVIAERFRYHKRDQKQGETIMQYISELRNLAMHCNFGDYLGYTLHDRFVCGLHNENIQKNLLSKEDLTLLKTVKTAVAT